MLPVHLKNIDEILLDIQQFSTRAHLFFNWKMIFVELHNVISQMKLVVTRRMVHFTRSSESHKNPSTFSPHIEYSIVERRWIVFHVISFCVVAEPLLF